MSTGYELGGRYAQDPIGAQGRSTSQRKSAHDGPAWTPSEKRLKDRLMLQFCQGIVGTSAAYRTGFDGIDWGER